MTAWMSSEWVGARQTDGFVADCAAATPGRTGSIISSCAAHLFGIDSAPMATDLSDDEHAVLAMAEQFFIDAHGVGEAMFADVLRYYDQAEVVAMMMHMAVTDGFIKRRIVAGDA